MDMGLIAPIITDNQALMLIQKVLVKSSNINTFYRVLNYLVQNNILRLRIAEPVVNYGNYFSTSIDDGTARFLYRFTIAQLQRLVIAMKLPEVIFTPNLLAGSGLPNASIFSNVSVGVDL